MQSTVIKQIIKRTYCEIFLHDDNFCLADAGRSWFQMFQEEGVAAHCNAWYHEAFLNSSCEKHIIHKNDV